MKKRVLPVIHVETREQAFRNVEIAKACGADGIFLISHGIISDKELWELSAEVKKRFFPIWVGINCLGLSAQEVVSMLPNDNTETTVDGIWTDNAKIDEQHVEQHYAEKVLSILRQRLPNTMYFGGVAFKYQRAMSQLEDAVKYAAPWMDVICTSGPGTGYAADLDKIKRMSHVAPLALASGITPDNVENYLPYVDYFLVATGIGKSFTEIDPEKLTNLINKVKQFSHS